MKLRRWNTRPSLGKSRLGVVDTNHVTTDPRKDRGVQSVSATQLQHRLVTGSRTNL
jgi:hypothetical protein